MEVTCSREWLANTLFIKVGYALSWKLTLNVLFPSQHKKSFFSFFFGRSTSSFNDKYSSGNKIRKPLSLNMWQCVFCFRRQPFMCVSILHVCVHALRELPLEWIIYGRVSFAYVRSTDHGHIKFRCCRHRRRPLFIARPAAPFPACPIRPLQMLPPAPGLCIKSNKKS